MLRWIVIMHRYLGIALCLFFAMWFASGIVMLFVPYPKLTDTERFAGMPPLSLQNCCVSLSNAFVPSGLREPPQRVRLTMIGERPAWHFHPSKGKVISIYADTGEPVGSINSAQAVQFASRFMPGPVPTHAAFDEYDQWTVADRWDVFRPFHRIAMNDALGTELYVSAQSGEVVRDTNRNERMWNWLGSVVHWIYPTVLRKHPVIWDRVVWWLALIGIVAATSGIVLGILRFRFTTAGRYAKRSPYAGWMYWHHILGLGCATFVLTWIISGWLSMDHGLLFSDSKPTTIQQQLLAGGELNLQRVRINFSGIGLLNGQQNDRVKEIELVQLAGKPFYLLRHDSARAVLIDTTDDTPKAIAQFSLDLITEAAGNLVESGRLREASMMQTYDDYYYDLNGELPMPVVRLRFDDPAKTWFYIDPLTARVADRVDQSRRAYRWLYSGMHTFDFHFLATRPSLRITLMTVFCALGFAFSVTGITIGWRRLTRDLIAKRPAMHTHR